MVRDMEKRKIFFSRYFAYTLMFLSLALGFLFVGVISKTAEPIYGEVSAATDYTTVDLATLYSIKDNPTALAQVKNVNAKTYYNLSPATEEEKVVIYRQLEVIKLCPNLRDVDLKLRGCELGKDFLNNITAQNLFIYRATVNFSGVSNTSLHSLSMWGTSVKNFSQMPTGLPNLTSLTCYCVDGFSIVDFSKLTKLSYLWLSQNISSYSQLCQKITQVNSLYLSDSNLKNSDTQYIGKLSNLTNLYLSGTSVDDISFLRNLPKLGNVSLPDSVRNLDVLYDISNLRCLTFTGFTETNIDSDLDNYLLSKWPDFKDRYDRNISTKIKNIISSLGFTSSTSQFEKIEKITYYVCTHMTYVDVINTGTNLDTAVNTGKGVCNHYAIFMQALLRAAGIEAYYIAGYPSSPAGGYYYERHAWNVVRVNGVWYGIDATWIDDDSLSTLSEFKNSMYWNLYYMKKTTTTATVWPSGNKDVNGDRFALEHFSWGDPSINNVSANSTVSSLSVTKPNKTEYIKNKESLDLTGGKLKVTYSDGVTTSISLSNYMVSVTGFSNSTVGTKTINVSFGGLSTSFNVVVKEPVKTITSISINKYPNLSYKKGQALSLSGGELKVYYTIDGVSGNEIVSMTASGVSYSGYNANTVGSQRVTISYQGKTTYITVTVAEPVKTITSISINNYPNLSYKKGQALSLAGGELKVYYTIDGVSGNEIVSMTASGVSSSGYNANTVGSQRVTISYQGKTTYMTVTVSEPVKTVDSISIYNTGRLKTSYNKGESLDLSGGYLLVTYNDGSSKYVQMTSADGVITSWFNPEKVGEQKIVIFYENKYVYLNVTVNDVVNIEEEDNHFEHQQEDVLEDTNSNDDVTITAIEIDTLPSKVTYTIGDELVLNGGIISITYNDGTTKNIEMTSDMIEVSGYDSQKSGNQTIKIKYNALSTEYNVYVDSNTSENHGLNMFIKCLIILAILVFIGVILILIIAHINKKSKQTKRIRRR